MASIEAQIAELRANFNNEKEHLEQEIRQMKGNIANLEAKLSYYDRLAVKTGAYFMGVLSLGAILVMGFDKVKDKIIAWIFP